MAMPFTAGASMNYNLLRQEQDELRKLAEGYRVLCAWRNYRRVLARLGLVEEMIRRADEDAREWFEKRGLLG